MRVWKTPILYLIVLNLLAGAATLVFSAEDKFFVGEIADTPCAMKVHSLDKTHTEMLKVAGVGTTATDCTLYCIKNRGGRFVLQNKRNVYLLDNQELPERYAGQKVRITGTLDPKTETIQVRSIDPLTEK
jgi:hypothetical protein